VMLYAPQKGAPLALAVTARQVGRYSDEIGAVAPDGTKVVVRPQAAGGPTTGVLRFAAPNRGVVPVELSTGQNAAMVGGVAPNGWLLLEASQRRPLHVISRVGRLHFFVPHSTRSFAAFGRGSGTVENVRVNVYSPDGVCMSKASAQGGATATARVDVAAEHRGKVWWLTADRPPELKGVFEDATLWLSDDVPAYVSPRADGLLVPFCTGLQRPPMWRGKGGVALTFGLNIEPPPDATLSVMLDWPRRSAPPRATGPAAQPLKLMVEPSLPAGSYKLRVRLRKGDGKVLAEGTSDVTLTSNLAYVGATQALVGVEVRKREGKLPTVAIRRNIGGRDVPMNAHVTLLRTRNPEPPGRLGADVVVQRELRDVGETAVVLEPPARLPDGHYQWKVVARTPDGGLVDVQVAHFLLQSSDEFSEVPPPAAPPLPLLSAGDAERGFVGFAAEAADAIVYNYRPQPPDLRRKLRVALARDEYEPATLGIWAWDDVRGLKVAVSPLTHTAGKATLPVDVRIARHWPQRRSWRTSTYRIIPEMLEANTPFDLALGQLKQLWLTVHAARDAVPGVYRATVTVRDAKGRTWQTPFEARVLPFVLQRPTKVHWGLYSDSHRWRRYPDSQVQVELADVAAHGITTLMCYPPAHSTATYENGQLTVDSSEFIKYMRMARKAGLGPPWVMSLQALATVTKKLVPGKALTDPEFKKVYQDYTRHLVALARREGWGECVWHTIDEPWSKKAHDMAVVQLGYMKELGVTTFTTAGPVSADLDAMLDVRCYSYGHLLRSKEVLAEQSRKTAESGDRLWYYGSG